MADTVERVKACFEFVQLVYSDGFLVHLDKIIQGRSFGYGMLCYSHCGFYEPWTGPESSAW